jgi:16S rRNA (guanine527-N7)-methyltransferase
LTANQPDRIAAGAIALGVALNEEQIAMLHRYLDLLEKWNAAFNLTAVRGRGAMEVEHILDSLAIAPQVNAGPVLDVGTGGGLPGMVLAIARPEWHYLLVDSNGKKTRFLKQAVHELGLRNVTVKQARIEELTDSNQADGVATPAIIVSRAFASLPDMVQGCRRFFESGAQLLAMKGVRPDEEIAALPADAKVLQVIPLAVPGLGKERHLICIVHDDGAQRTP